MCVCVWPEGWGGGGSKTGDREMGRVVSKTGGMGVGMEGGIGNEDGVKEMGAGGGGGGAIEDTVGEWGGW